jgi:hypothetical protein
VLLEASVHAPAPSHVPVNPQVVVPPHWPAGAVWPAPMFAQVPAAFRLQDWQVPQEAVEQQTPSTQLPLVHSLPATQTTPNAFFGLQLPPVPVQ